MYITITLAPSMDSEVNERQREATSNIPAKKQKIAFTQHINKDSETEMK